jgi:mRNA-degrading endonuclease RelE of RelBE toxin-antitoxin system
VNGLENIIRILAKLEEWHRSVEEEVARGFNAQKRELNAFERGIELLRRKHNAGKHVKMQHHPRPYQYYNKLLGEELDNLWRLALGSDLRMIYTIVGAARPGCVCFVIDFKHHKDYNKIFGYKG